jgi:branched-chain amino acid transport system substrate-binding protein
MTPNNRWKSLAALLLALTMVAAACGGRDEGSDGGDDGGSGGSDSTEETTDLADPAQCENYDGTQGVTDDKILIGNSLPQSGLFSVFDKVRVGIEAYFSYANSEGGIDGRDLELKSLDDQYLPERTRTNVETLVNTDGVFALLGMVGTENNVQASQFLAEQGLCVPNLAVATGFPGFGDPAADPWIINGLPNYALESIAFADYLSKNKPEATVAILAQNDSFGESYVEAFKKAIEGTDITLVDEQTFDPKTETNPQGQVTTLASSGADALLLGVTSLPCPNALKAVKDSGWAPLTYVTLTCSSKVLMDVAGDASEGTISTRATYDPSDPASASEAPVVEFKEQGAAAGLTEADINDLNVSAGWGFGAYLVQLLKASPELERASVMNTAWFQKDVSYGLQLEGLSWNTDGEKDPFGINQLQFITRTGGQWVPEGEVVDYSTQLEAQLGE